MTRKKNRNRGWVFILPAAGLLLALFIAFAVMQYGRSRDDLVSMLHDEGVMLLNTLTASGERSILAYEELEHQVRFRLLNNARRIEERDREGRLDSSFLNRILSRMDLHQIHIVNRQGQRISARAPSFSPADTAAGLMQDSRVLDFIQNPDSDSLIIGFRQGQYDGEPKFAVAVRRRDGGAVIVVADAERLLSFRQELGPGRLVQEISRQRGIEYIVLQDTIGILLASQNVTDMSRLETDPFLSAIHTSESPGTRFHPFNGRDVYEIAGIFSVEGQPLGLFRIGLSAAHYQNLLLNARWRLVFIVLLFLLIGIAGLSVLVTRQSHRLLNESYQRVKTHTGKILQNMEDGVLVIDKNHKITLINEAACRLFNLSRKRALGADMDDLNIPAFDIFHQTLQTGESREHSKAAIQIKKKRQILSLRTSVVVNLQNEIEHVILMATDLTRQTALEEELRQQEKMNAMGKLASGVAHEIRNPVNAMGMIAQRFLKEFTPTSHEEEYRELATTLVEETRRSDAIIRRFLDFARPAELIRTTTPIHRLLEESTALFLSTAQNRSIELNLKKPDPAELNIDGDQIKQVIINLLSNSMDALETQGRIDITGIATQGEYIIHISDTGPGIPDEVKPKIFDLYFTTKKEGLGMGLSIAYQIIQRHNGNFHVESREGEGTTVTLTLPG